MTSFATAGQKRSLPGVCFVRVGQNVTGPMIASIAGTSVTAATAATTSANTTAGPAKRKTLNRAKHNIARPDTVISADEAIAPKLASRPCLIAS
jgi:hypothetical protein